MTIKIIISSRVRIPNTYQYWSTTQSTNKILSSIRNDDEWRYCCLAAIDESYETHFARDQTHFARAGDRKRSSNLARVCRDAFREWKDGVRLCMCVRMRVDVIRVWKRPRYKSALKRLSASEIYKRERNPRSLFPSPRRRQTDCPTYPVANLLLS